MRRRAIAPLTIGADMDVPLFVEYPFFRLLHAVMLEPATTSSGFGKPSVVGPRPE